MAFVTQFVGDSSTSNAYNIDFSVGPGVRGNRPTDIMLVQALMRIIYFEVEDHLKPPAGDKSIEVDGKLGPATMRFILETQRSAKAAGNNIRVDGICDPFRAQGELSHIARVEYVLQLLNNVCRLRCRVEGKDFFSNLPNRTDIPQALRSELKLPPRAVAKQYANGG